MHFKQNGMDSRSKVPLKSASHPQTCQRLSRKSKHEPAPCKPPIFARVSILGGPHEGLLLYGAQSKHGFIPRHSFFFLRVQANSFDRQLRDRMTRHFLLVCLVTPAFNFPKQSGHCDQPFFQHAWEKEEPTDQRENPTFTKRARARVFSAIKGFQFLPKQTYLLTCVIPPLNSKPLFMKQNLASKLSISFSGSLDFTEIMSAFQEN